MGYSDFVAAKFVYGCHTMENACYESGDDFADNVYNDVSKQQNNNYCDNNCFDCMRECPYKDY